MALRALELLAEDNATEVIGLISKPPDDSVARRIRAAAEQVGKPVILGFMGISTLTGEDVEFSLEGVALRLATEVGLELDLPSVPPTALTPGYVRGLFSGGSLCYEAMAIFSRATGESIHSNIPLPEPHGRQLDDIERSVGHTFIDYGDERFTRRRAHPMIDPSLRNDRLQRESADPEVGVVMLDVVLGDGAHPDPARTVSPIIAEAMSRRPDSLTIVVALCSARDDPQDAPAQEDVLRRAGALVVPNAAQAARTSLVAAGHLNGVR